jgi:hypothetical protein
MGRSTVKPKTIPRADSVRALFPFSSLNNTFEKFTPAFAAMIVWALAVPKLLRMKMSMVKNRNGLF